MKWTIAHARRHFSQLLQAAAREPQEVCNRERPVAAIVNVETFRRFCQWQDSPAGASVAGAFDELRTICAEENYTLESPARVDRVNLWTEALDELPG